MTKKESFKEVKKLMTLQGAFVDTKGSNEKNLKANANAAKKYLKKPK